MKWSFILFLPAIVSIVWALFTTMSKRRLTRAQLLLALMLLVSGFAMVSFVIYFRGKTGVWFIYDYMFHLAAVYCAPMYYISICSLTGPRGATLRQRQAFLLPLIYVVGLTAGAFWLGPRRYEAMCHAMQEGTASWVAGDAAYNFMLVWLHQLFPFLLLFSGFLFLLLATRKALLFQRRFNSYYVQGINGRKIDSRGIVVLSWMFLPLGALTIYFGYFRPYYFKYWLIVLAVLMTAVQWMIGHYNHRMDYDARYLADYIRNEMKEVES